ncbi:phage tail assembly chaperone G [Carnobacterium maltaromaticum]|uniref:phage tail assembly chaperone G n=1 Tax=Carnobacterium maltaromaticum TaxID=2751 RepID=UPI0012FC438F|nr:hypothetical protein [Carnobacterium maltaromaticum]
MGQIKIELDWGEGKKEFIKRKITIRDNLIAAKHAILESDYYAEEVRTAEGYEKVQLDFAESIVSIFGNEFTADQLLDGLALEDHEVLQDIYVEALGGKVEDEKK